MSEKKHSVLSGAARQSPLRIAFSWLLLLRWGAVLYLLILILFMGLFFEIRVPMVIVSIIIAFQCVSNFFFSYLRNRQTEIPEWLFGLVMILDVILLTVLLYYTGGPMNPFTFLYLLHIVLGSILMRPAWAWSLTLFTVFCYACFFHPAGLFILDLICRASMSEVPGEISEICESVCIGSAQNDYMTLHLQGMWVAFSVTAIFMVFFVGRIQKSLEEHQLTLSRLEEQTARSEKLASLATLAAGAAHEFSSPLSTIAVASKEMLRSLKQSGGEQQLIEDAILIREEVNRCKEILYQMAADAGEHMGEAVEELQLQPLLAEILASVSAAGKELVRLENEAGNLRLKLPPRTMRRTAVGLINNALDASAEGSPVLVSCTRDSRYLYLEIKDSGEGMDQETLLKATEPFFSKKKSGKGLGLGLYLAKEFAERFGGELHIYSEPGKGTSAVLSLELKHILIV